MSKSGMRFNVSASADARSTGHITRGTRATHVRRGVKSAPAALQERATCAGSCFPAIINKAVINMISGPLFVAASRCITPDNTGD